MKSRAALLYIILLSLIPVVGSGQSCAILSKANNMVPDQLCSPVTVSWDVTYVGVNNAGTTVEIHYDWDDGSEETVVAAEGPAGTFNASANHVYTSQDDRCNHHPVATLVVNGVMCTSSSQEQIVTIWDTDNKNGGFVYADPSVYPVCIGNGATMSFIDYSQFNCVPPQENDVPNEDTRWIQWVYGTKNTMSSATPVSVDGYTGPWPLVGPVITLPGPVHGSDEVSLPITVADDNQIGDEFQIELRYWNQCNPYLPGMPEEPAEVDHSVIRIVDLPDPTITPVDTLCEFNDNVVLTVATGGGTFTGSGIVNASTGEFAPYVAGPGNHKIKYEVTDGNNCSAADSIIITVTDAPDADITPVDPFCIYDPPFDLESSPASGTWSGTGITSSSQGIFDPAVAGIGAHPVAFITAPDALGCTGVDSTVIIVADIPGAEILSPDSAWCDLPDNTTIGKILITGDDSTSLFDLVVDFQGTVDTLFNLPADTLELELDNQVGMNRYALRKVIEHHGNTSCETELKDTLSLEVYPKPDMSLQTTWDEWCSPVDVQLSAQPGYDNYYWRFGDNDSSTTHTPDVSHTYTIPSGDSVHFYVDTIDGVIDTTYYNYFQGDTTFYLQLAVESFFGCLDTITDSVTIYESPEADFFVSPVIQNYPETNVFLINTSSYGIWSYLWDYGDSETDTLKEPGGHEYGDYGFFDIELTTYNEFCTDSIIKRVQILPPPPVAEFEPDSIGCPPLEIQFENLSDYADSYVWDFDDGTFSTDINPVHTFYQSKDHHVIMSAFGMSGTDTVEHIIGIYDKPTAFFSVAPTEAKNLKQQFRFKNSSVDGVNYQWDFGDGKTSPVESPTHIYGEAGTYTVTLVVWNEHECTDTMTIEDAVKVTAGEGSTEFPDAFIYDGGGASGGGWTETEYDNTVFHPNFINAIGLEMQVYTRWGEMVWETKELYTGWDGHLKSGELASPGVYIYRAKVKYADNRSEVYVGSVTFLHRADSDK